jgi:hypothetical protein
MLPKNVWLAAPFLVLAIVVTSFTVTPLWMERRAAELREPAYTALASSVQALGALIEMREQAAPGHRARGSGRRCRWSSPWRRADQGERVRRDYRRDSMVLRSCSSCLRISPVGSLAAKSAVSNT